MQTRTTPYGLGGMLTALALTGLLSQGCTEAERAKKLRLTSAAKITCYSCGVKIFEGKSTGRVIRGEGSLGEIEFVDAADGKFKQITAEADCIFEYE